MKKFLGNSLSLILMICAIFGLHGLTYAQNEPTREQLQKEIRLTDRLLNETENKEEKTLSELTVLNRQISLRKKLLSTLTDEIEAQEAEIQQLAQITCQMEADIEQIKANYGETAQLTYKSFDSENFLLSLLSSGSLTEAYYRALYFQQFSDYRQNQVQLIEKARSYLNEKSERLEQSIAEKEFLIDEKIMEMKRLSSAKSTHKGLYTSLRKKEKSFRNQLNDRRNQLNKEISASEKTPIKTKNRIVPAKPKVEKVKADYGRTFSRNKGFIPWPIPSSKGIVVGKFGKTEDPYGNPITNDGIYIRTSKGQEVRSVYQGKVTGVKSLPMGGGNMVIVEHGEFRTVYANLEKVFVSEGESVKTNGKVGTVRTDKRTGETVLNFLIYKAPTTFLDPEKWIIRVGSGR